LKAAFNLGVSHTQVRHLLSLVEAPKEANKIKKLERFPAARNLGINDHYLRSLLSIKLVEMKGWNQLAAAANLGIGYTVIWYFLSLLDAPKEVKEQSWKLKKLD